jgi:hypothetical protein
MNELMERVCEVLNHYASYPSTDGSWYVYDSHAFIKSCEDKPVSEITHPTVFEMCSDSISCQQRVIGLNAIAVIEAMRKPTDAMKDAGAEGGEPAGQCESIWERMIDEALK